MKLEHLHKLEVKKEMHRKKGYLPIHKNLNCLYCHFSIKINHNQLLIIKNLKENFSINSKQQLIEFVFKHLNDFQTKLKVEDIKLKGNFQARNLLQSQTNIFKTNIKVLLQIHFRGNQLIYFIKNTENLILHQSFYHLIVLLRNYKFKVLMGQEQDKE